VWVATSQHCGKSGVNGSRRPGTSAAITPVGSTHNADAAREGISRRDVELRSLAPYNDAPRHRLSFEMAREPPAWRYRMGFTAEPAKFALPENLTSAVKGKRVFITGSGRDGGLGQAFALSAGLNGAASVAVHFHNSYADGLDTVDAINAQGGHAFGVQADVTNPRDVWAMRSYVIDKMGAPPDLVVCNSGRSEKGYMLGRIPRSKDEESPAMRRARVRQAFVENLEQSRDVIDTKLDGALAVTHLWASEAIHAGHTLSVIYISSRQAVDPGPGVPGYCAANWSVLALPKILRTNLGRNADKVRAFCVGYPFVRTSMTQAYADNAKVFGRWQSRMLEPHEAAHALFQLVDRSYEETAEKFFQLEVDGPAEDLSVRWSEVIIEARNESCGWSDDAPLKF
jgi:NAD(P)-dependent dehydrogenase (short-subunit alcohol dehydrogenase family)